MPSLCLPAVCCPLPPTPCLKKDPPLPGSLGHASPPPAVAMSSSNILWGFIVPDLRSVVSWGCLPRPGHSGVVCFWGVAPSVLGALLLSRSSLGSQMGSVGEVGYLASWVIALGTSLSIEAVLLMVDRVSWTPLGELGECASAHCHGHKPLPQAPREGACRQLCLLGLARGYCQVTCSDPCTAVPLIHLPLAPPSPLH